MNNALRLSGIDTNSQKRITFIVSNIIAVDDDKYVVVNKDDIYYVDKNSVTLDPDFISVTIHKLYYDSLNRLANLTKYDDEKTGNSYVSYDDCEKILDERYKQLEYLTRVDDSSKNNMT